MNRPSLRALAAGVGGLAVATAGAVGLSYGAARGVPLSPLHGDGRIGAGWVDRRGLRGDDAAGELESLDAYARPGFDPDGVHPAVRALYERTSEFRMTVDATWHRPFRLGARLAARWTSRVEQLNLPGPGGAPKRLDSDLAELAPHAAAEDPRDGPRLWLRTDAETGEGVFTAVYASHRRGGEPAADTSDGQPAPGDERFVNVAVPLPGASLATVLRMDHLGDGLELTTECPNGGLYLHTDAGAFRLPASQRFRVAPARDPAAPAPPDGVDRYDADVLADQRIRLVGLPLVTVRYAATRD